MVFLLVVGAIVLAFLVGRVIVQSKEESVVKIVAENAAYCLPNSIQDREDFTLYLALEGLNEVDLESILEPAVQKGYNRASEECSDQ